jgi:LPXTG-site transpeptidase (sortase) family protein
MTRRRHHRTVGDRLTALLAELLILAGAGTGLYVVWVAWWTDVVAARSQASFAASLEQAASSDAIGERRDAPPVLDEPGAATVFATMHVPRFGADFVRPIAQGTDRATVLNTIGLGHYENTAMPGGIGNVAIAGHRVTYGKPLNRIAELQDGDPIIVRVTDRAADFDVWYVYRVSSHAIVTPDRVDVIAPVPGDPTATPTASDRMLTLTACHPMWSAAERYVVHATFDSWTPAADGTPKELL